jgi:hypothetical protein
VAVLPGALQDVAVLEPDLPLAVELAIFELTLVDAAVSFSPLETTRTGYQVILEIASEDASAGGQ